MQKMIVKDLLREKTEKCTKYKVVDMEMLFKFFVSIKLYARKIKYKSEYKS